MIFRPIINHKLALPIGLSSLAIALIIERFLPSSNGFNFITGFLIGISVVFNLSGILKLRKAK